MQSRNGCGLRGAQSHQRGPCRHYQRKETRHGSENNIKTVQKLYEAFGRGDVQTIIDNVTVDVDWAAEASSTVAPWYGARQGKDGVGAFFQAFGSAVEVLEFTPTAFARMTPTSLPSFAIADPPGPRARRPAWICTTGSDSAITRSITTGAPKTQRRVRLR